MSVLYTTGWYTFTFPVLQCISNPTHCFLLIEGFSGFDIILRLNTIINMYLHERFHDPTVHVISYVYALLYTIQLTSLLMTTFVPLYSKYIA